MGNPLLKKLSIYHKVDLQETPQHKFKKHKQKNKLKNKQEKSPAK